MPRDLRKTFEASTHTRVLAEFHTDEPGGFFTVEPIQSAPGMGSIIGCQISKKFGAASGTWSLTFKKDQQTLRQFSALRLLWRDPEDVWVRIKFLVDGQIIDTMLGLIDSIKESTQRTGQGQRSETYTITGRDFGKVFEQTQLFVNFYHNPQSPLRSATALMRLMLQGQGTNIAGTPEHFVRLLMEEWVGNSGVAEAQWRMPQSLSGEFFGNFVNTRIGIESMRDLENGIALAPELFKVDSQKGSLWDSMQQYSNPALNELFVDYAPSTSFRSPEPLDNQIPAVWLRERPFPTRSDDGRTQHAKWDRLPTHTLKPGDVVSRDIAKGGASHRFNYWTVQLQGPGSESYNVQEFLQRGIDGVQPGFPGNIPIWNDQSIQTHGVRPYTLSSRFLPIPLGDEAKSELLRSQNNVYRLAARFLKKVHDWYVIAPFELSGTIATSRVFPEIRIGQRVREERAEGTIVYYVEGVQHTYNYPGPGKTTLTLTRGEYEGDDLLEYVYEQYEQPRSLSAAESCFEQLGGEDALGVSAQEFEELGLFDAQCRFIAPEDIAPRAQVRLGSGPPEGIVAEGSGFNVNQGQRTLQAEQDGRQPSRLQQPDQLVSEGGKLDGTEPSVGDQDRIPPASEAQDRSRRPNDASPIDQQSLERGEPIDDGGLDDLSETDPIGGLEGT